MRNKTSTFYDYTKSAEDIRLFNLKEKCHNIALEYYKFNTENRVYELFGEWFLGAAKSEYRTMFTSNDLKQILRNKDLELPSSHNIECKDEDVEKVIELREMCDGKVRYERCLIDYLWYTMWQIAKAYNCKNGCIVVESPHYSRYTGMIEINFDWSKNAADCITREKWKDEAKEESIGVLKWWFLVSGGMASIFSVLGVLSAMLGIISDDFFSYIFFKVLFGCILLGTIISPFVNSIDIKHEQIELSKDFTKHCQNIQEAKYSWFSVESGKIINRYYL